MSGYKWRYGIYTVNNPDFECAVDELIGNCRKEEAVCRLIFFGEVKDNVRYRSGLAVIRDRVKRFFGEKEPLCSYVAQPVLDGTLSMEVHKVTEGAEVEYCDAEGVHYILLEDEDQRELVLGNGGECEGGIFLQSERLFRQFGKILEKENYRVDNIVRQWNYIEGITLFTDHHQHYQDFNNARAHFYAGWNWTHGYPAATGIGTEKGGVWIDLNAVASKSADLRCVPLDNEWQVAAHAYSPAVLADAGKEKTDEKLTPKFERAKVITGKSGGLVYISGTAAIRGEQSVADCGLQEQIRLTVENILFLISERNLHKAGITSQRPCELQMLRVYLKNAGDIAETKETVGRLFPEVPAVYLQADVCRDELLVEIEGVARY